MSNLAQVRIHFNIAYNHVLQHRQFVHVMNIEQNNMKNRKHTFPQKIFPLPK